MEADEQLIPQDQQDLVTQSMLFALLAVKLEDNPIVVPWWQSLEQPHARALYSDIFTVAGEYERSLRGAAPHGSPEGRANHRKQLEEWRDLLVRERKQRAQVRHTLTDGVCRVPRRTFWD